MGMNVTMDAAQLASLYQTALQGAGVENVLVTVSEDGKSLTISSLNSDGSVRDTQMIGNIPEIDLPSGTAVGDSATLASFVNNLSDVVKTLSGLDAKNLDVVGKNFNEAAQRFVNELSSNSGGTGKVSVMYCIYRLMALMLEVAREQREVAREQREADTQMVVSEMEAQCQSMIDNAITGMITCCVVSCIQLGAIGISASRENSVTRKQSDVKTASGEATFENVNAMAAKAGNSETMASMKAESTQRLDASVQKLIANNDVSEQVRTDAVTAKETIDAKFKEIDNLQAEDVKQAMNLENEPTEQQIAEFKAGERTKVYEQLKTERADAQREFLASVKDGSVNDLARDKMAVANAKLEYGAARRLEFATPAEQEAIKTESAVDLKNACMDSDRTMATDIAAQQRKNAMFDQVTNTIATMLKDISTQAGTLRDAQTRQYDQAIELSRETRDSTKDLVAVALDMFKNMLNVLNSILDSENATFREIMG